MSSTIASYCVVFFNDTATTEIYTLSLHDALPISGGGREVEHRLGRQCPQARPHVRSEEHTSELQSAYLVCRLLLEKKKNHSTSRSSMKSRAVCSDLESSLRHTR